MGGLLASTLICGFICQAPMAEAASVTDTVIHDFAGPVADGSYPQARLVPVGNDRLYGTTETGGAGTQCGVAGCGTIFELSQNDGKWKYKVLHSFVGSDGAWPVAALIDVGGTLYGTTVYGGTGFGSDQTCAGHAPPSGCGTVFSIQPNGTNFKVLYSFTANTGDGVYPMAGLLNVEGLLYGTTFAGGTNGTGSLFSVSASGVTDKILYDFGTTTSGDGYEPEQSLTNIDGTLYGMTDHGGAGTCDTGCGTIFSYTIGNGHYAKLYSFLNNGIDGSFPAGALVKIGDTLYGTTYLGGSVMHCNGLMTGCGTVFSFKPGSGNPPTVLHNFANGPDGSNPLDTLVNVNGTLYGTALLGGSQTSCEGACGTVFSISPSGAHYKTVYEFCGATCNDGYYPYAGLVQLNGALYGTTLRGGDTKCSTLGCGIVFELPED